MRRLLRAIRRLLFRPLVLGAIVGVGLCAAAWQGDRVTRTDDFCASCHVHPQATASWKKSPHYDNDSGVFVHCVQCHLPPKGPAYLVQKVRTGARDIWGKLFGDPEHIDWEARGRFEHARTHVYQAACVECHANLFPISLSEEGDEAHLHYEQHQSELWDPLESTCRHASLSIL